MLTNIHDSAVGQRELSQHGSNYSLYEKNSALHAPRLVGTLGEIGIIDRMLATNPTVRIGYLSMVATLTSVDYDLTDDPRIPRRVLAFVRELLFDRPKKRFGDYINTILKAPAYGFAPHEMISKIEDGKVWLADLDYRPPRTFDLYTVERVGTDDTADGEWIRATQRFYNNQGFSQSVRYDSPGTPGAGVLFWPVFGEGLFGESVLRPIYNEHLEKESIRKIRFIAVQKALFGTLLVKEREEHETAQEDVDETVAELGDLFIHEQGAVNIPGWCESVEPAYAQSDAISKAIEAENHADIQILLSFASQWLGRGLLAAYGSNAASETDTAEQRNLRRYYFEWLSSQIQKIIDYYVDLNFGPQRVYPELKAIYHEEFTLKEEAEAAVRLATSQGLVWDKPIRDHFRLAYGWPEETAEAQASIDAAKTAPAAPGGELDKSWHADAPDNRIRESEGNYT